MSVIERKYDKVITEYLIQVSSYQKIEIAENKSKERISDFYKFIKQHEILFEKFTGIEKQILDLADSYQFDKIFDYSFLEKSVPGLQLLVTKISSLLKNTRHIVNNKRHSSDKFVKDLKQLVLSCKDEMKIADVKSKTDEVDKLTLLADNGLKEIETINKLIHKTELIIKVIVPFYDRYNKADVEKETKRIIEFYRYKSQISDLPKIYSVLSQQYKLLQDVALNFENEKSDLQEIEKSLASNVNIWKDDARNLTAQIQGLLPKLETSYFDLEKLKIEIKQKEAKKESAISDYEKELKEDIKEYQDKIDEFRKKQKYKAEFEKLKLEIKKLEKKKLRESVIFVIVALAVVALLVWLVLLIIEYPWHSLGILVGIGAIVGFIFWYRNEY